MNRKQWYIFSILTVIFISGCVNQPQQIELPEETQICIEPTQTQTLNLYNSSRSIIANHYNAFSYVVQIDDKKNNLIYGNYYLDSDFLKFYIFDQKNFNSWDYGQDHQYYYVSSKENEDFRFVPDHSDVYYFIVHNTFIDRNEGRLNDTQEGNFSVYWVNFNYTGNYRLNINWVFNYKDRKCV